MNKETGWGGGGMAVGAEVADRVPLLYPLHPVPLLD